MSDLKNVDQPCNQVGTFLLLTIVVFLKGTLARKPRAEIFKLEKFAARSTLRPKEQGCEKMTGEQSLSLDDIWQKLAGKFGEES